MLYARRPCDRCGEPWSGKAFYDGRPGICKECHKARVYRRRADPQVKAHDYERVKLRLKRSGEWKRNRMTKWRIENREKDRAINTVSQAVKNYSLVRGRRCVSCGTDKNVCAFHDDYSKPLKVTWSCRPCRAKEMKARRRAA
jgi:hypothetical protein